MQVPPFSWKTTLSALVDMALICNLFIVSHCPGSLTDIASEETHGSQMMAVTSNNKLLIVDLVSGRCLKEVQVLGSRYTRLKSINWAEHEEKVVLSTTRCQKQMDELGSRAAVMDTLKILAVFNTMPLEFECMFEVKKRVFGSDTVDAIMSQGHLITMHQSRLVRMYDLQDLLPKAKPVKLFDSAYSPGTFHGQAPTPLPINLVISELPPCLFEVACSEHNVQIGGFPWHYLISPPGRAGTFNVYSVDTGSLAKNGHLDSNNDCLEMDRASFHGDESGRIIHISAENVSVYYLKHDSSLNCNALMQAFIIRLQDQKPSLMCPTTASGRKIKRRFTADEIFGSDICLTIHEVDYEDELDVMVICSTIHQSDSLCGKVGFYDNATGHHLTSFNLDEPWCDYMEHSINMDLDTIVHLVKSTQGKFACQVYRLAEAIADDDLIKVMVQKKGQVKGRGRMGKNHKLELPAAEDSNSCCEDGDHINKEEVCYCFILNACSYH
ncbi:DDB1- and CUL4-associated factor 17-like isoform X2 [Pomacea canaliculata]|uniref:DDB1- and CUL4-associated factor 17-like isoform X2 n=2 Tax=Pomacea canaliculata TaxID=400727 RepID=UPI000D73D0CA|nr:DDB1- and CUL4-associated factor 17-like isoform X2 [Pomacea canaliculata]